MGATFTQVKEGASYTSMREALKHSYSGKEMSIKDVFNELDEDNSGFLDREEVFKAAGVLAATLGLVVTEVEQEKQYKAMDPDGDGQITLAEFEVWWKEQEVGAPTIMFLLSSPALDVTFLYCRPAPHFLHFRRSS